MVEQFRNREKPARSLEDTAGLGRSSAFQKAQQSPDYNEEYAAKFKSEVHAVSEQRKSVQERINVME